MTEVSLPKTRRKTSANSRRKSALNGPTILTIARMFLSVVFLILVLIPTLWTRTLALLVFIAASLTDLIDGKWARKEKLVTDLGAFLDPLADKMLVNLAFLALVYLNAVPLWAFAIILVRDFAVDGMRMMAAKTGVTISASIYGKLKTTVQMITLSLLIFNLIVALEFLTVINYILIGLVLILTIFSGLDYLCKSWQKVIK